MAVTVSFTNRNRLWMAATILAGFLFLSGCKSVPMAASQGSRNNYWNYRYSQKKTDVPMRAYRPRVKRFPN